MTILIILISIIAWEYRRLIIAPIAWLSSFITGAVSTFFFGCVGLLFLCCICTLLTLLQLY
jgi:hypothetical protein